MKTLLFISALLFLSVGNSQPKKDDLAHMSGMMAIHSTTYIASNVLIDGWGKEWIPFLVGNGVGFAKEYNDTKKPYAYWSWNDIAYNNLGMALSFFLIKGLKEFGVDENVAAGMGVFVGTAGVGLSVSLNFK